MEERKEVATFAAIIAVMLLKFPDGTIYNIDEIKMISDNCANLSFHREDKKFLIEVKTVN